MKIAFKLLFISIIFSGLSFSRSIEEIQKSGYITIAIYEDFPPYSFVDKNKIEGIDIELGKIIAKSLKVQPRWYFTGSDENLSDDLRNNLWKGNLVHKTKADVMFRVPYDYDYLRLTDKTTGELENEKVTIKGSYQSEKWIIATHKKIIPKITTLGIFAYNNIGVQLDTLPDFHLSTMANGLIRKNVKHYLNFEDAVKDFKKGKLNAIAGLKSQIEYFLDFKNNKEKYYLTENIIQMKSQWDLATAVASNYRALSYHIDGVINKLYENGTIKKIFDKFGVEYVPPISKRQ